MEGQRKKIRGPMVWIKTVFWFFFLKNLKQFHGAGRVAQ